MNIGDIGHTPGTLRLLERYIPEAEILLWHAQPKPVTEAIVIKNFPKVKIIRGVFPAQNEAMTGELKEAFDKADIYLHNSGMSFNFGLFNSDLSTIVNNLTPFLYCIEHKIPFGLYGQSFDKFDPPAMSFYRDVFNRAAFIYCRDTESLKYLKENNFKTPILEFAPDGCFGIDVRDEEKGLAYLKETGLEENRFLVVVIRTNTPHPYAKKDNALNPANISPELKREDSMRLGKVIDVIKNWIHTTGYKVLLAPEAFKEMQSAKTMIVDKLPADIRSKVVCRDTFWSADEAMSVYARAHTLFGMEPHSLIMGLALGKPIIHARAIKYGKKAWMFRDIGLSEWLFDIDNTSAGNLTETLTAIVKEYPAALRKVKSAMLVVEGRQNVSLEIIEKIDN
jgi:polysaccharide pyruvyl transferase WcaK-like protein